MTRVPRQLRKIITVMQGEICQGCGKVRYLDQHRWTHWSMQLPRNVHGELKLATCPWCLHDYQQALNRLCRRKRE